MTGPYDSHMIHDMIWYDICACLTKVIVLWWLSRFRLAWRWRTSWGRKWRRHMSHLPHLCSNARPHKANRLCGVCKAWQGLVLPHCALAYAWWSSLGWHSALWSSPGSLFILVGSEWGISFPMIYIYIIFIIFLYLKLWSYNNNILYLLYVIDDWIWKRQNICMNDIDIARHRHRTGVVACPSRCF